MADVTLELKGLEDFKKTLRITVANSSKTISESLNARMFFLMTRAYLLTPPQDPAAARMNIWHYLHAQVGALVRGKRGKPRAMNKQLQRGMLILQSIRKRLGRKGLYGNEMRRQFGKFASKHITSAGYLKAIFIQAAARFSKYAFFAGNKAASGLAKGYGYALSASVKRTPFKGIKVKVTPATPGWKPEVTVAATIAVRSGQIPKVNLILNTALQGAMTDETRELKRHLEAKLQEGFDRVNARRK